jgi:hypothetical protein
VTNSTGAELRESFLNDEYVHSDAAGIKGICGRCRESRFLAKKIIH